MTSAHGEAVRVLVVDDAVFLRSMVREILDNAGGFEIVGEASSGAEAVTQYRRTRPDLVTMDIVMPEMDGIEATREILSSDPSAVIVMCSALGQEELVIESIKAGARDFIVKPYSAERVLEVLETVIPGSKMSDATTRMNMSKYLELYLTESREHLSAVEAELARLAELERDEPTIDELFRHAHSLKGMSASMGFEEVAELAHGIEDAIYAIKRDRIAFTGEMRSVLARGFDLVERMISRIGTNEPGSLDVSACLASLHALASTIASARSASRAASDPFIPSSVTTVSAGQCAPAGSPAHAERDPSGSPPMPQAAEAARFRVTLEFKDDALLPAARAAVAVKRLEGQGRVLHCAPTLAELARREFSGRLTVLLETPCSAERIRAEMRRIVDLRSVELAVEGHPERSGPRPGDPASAREDSRSEPRGADVRSQLVGHASEGINPFPAPDPAPRQDGGVGERGFEGRPVAVPGTPPLPLVSLRPSEPGPTPFDAYSSGREQETIGPAPGGSAPSPVARAGSRLPDVVRHAPGAGSGFPEHVQVAARTGETPGRIDPLPPASPRATGGQVDGPADTPNAAASSEVVDSADVVDSGSRHGPAERSLVPRTAPQPGALVSQTVRIPARSLDRFLDTVGELIVQRARLHGLVSVRADRAIDLSLERLKGLLDRLYADVMTLRLLPFESIAHRFMRSVRELADAQAKKVTLRISGGDVLLDRSMLDELSDPINHILRNSVDHGIESPGDRLAAGKAESGSIGISLQRAGDSVTIRIQDDGRGMDPGLIKRTALEKGFISRETFGAIDDADALMLATIPGFSTSARITSVSGRGVGMDVVRTRVETLGGHLTLKSSPGSGLAVEIRLPLTIVVVQAFVIEAGGHMFAVPISSVERTIQLRSDAVDGPGSLASAALADQMTTAIDLAALLSLEKRPRRLAWQALVVPDRGRRVAFAVDRIVEPREIVVKPLHAPLEELRGFSGATILDDGRIALVLDLPSLAAEPR